MANQTTNGKAPTLVVLQMAGANDYLNTVIPYCESVVLRQSADCAHSGRSSPAYR